MIIYGRSPFESARTAINIALTHQRFAAEFLGGDILEFTAEKSSQETPMAVLKDGTLPIMRVYLTADEKSIRIQLTELKAMKQLKINPATGIIEFVRTP